MQQFSMTALEDKLFFLVFCVGEQLFCVVVKVCAERVMCMFCCNLHFWQSGLDLLLAAAVTQGLNGY